MNLCIQFVSRNVRMNCLMRYNLEMKEVDRSTESERGAK